jgi:hypothetical protein
MHTAAQKTSPTVEIVALYTFYSDRALLPASIFKAEKFNSNYRNFGEIVPDL